MNFIINKYFSISLVFVVFSLLPFNYLLAFPKNSSFLILDFNSGTILDADNEKLKMQPASLTKLMTLYIIFECIEKNVITLSTKIPISPKAAGMPSSKLGLSPGKTITVKDIINSIIVKSANDATYAIAEYLGNGNEINFVELMNQKAHELDLRNTHFANSTGLTHPEQYSTAYDLSILARNLMLRFTKYYSLFSQKTFKWNNKIYKSTNHLLDYSNVDGLKTGYTYAAGFNLLVSSEINGFRIIITSLGNKSADARDNFVKQLVTNGIIIAKNFRLNNIKYKSPPQKVIAANNLLNSQTNNKIANLNESDTLLKGNPSSEISNQDMYNNIIVASNLQTPNNNDTNLQNDKAEIYNASLNNLKNNSLTVKNKINTNYNKDYYVQIGVFSNIKSAQKIANKAISLDTRLTKDNLKIDSINKNNSTLYRVRVNKLSNKEASKACYRLKNNNMACFVGTN